MTKVIYTSYFAKAGTNPANVAITVRPPMFAANMAHCKELAPSWTLVNAFKTGQINEEQYKVRYLEILRRKKIRPEDVVASLPDGAILLCYEKTGVFCHRHIAAEWLRQAPDVEVKELE